MRNTPPLGGVYTVTKKSYNVNGKMAGLGQKNAPGQKLPRSVLLVWGKPGIWAPVPTLRRYWAWASRRTVSRSRKSREMHQMAARPTTV